MTDRRAWASMPAELQQSFARIINAAAAVKGLVFNDVDPAPFRAKLASSGFYKTWKEKFGPEEWGLLEQATGPLG